MFFVSCHCNINRLVMVFSNCVEVINFFRLGFFLFNSIDVLAISLGMFISPFLFQSAQFCYVSSFMIEMANTFCKSTLMGGVFTSTLLTTVYSRVPSTIVLWLWFLPLVNFLNVSFFHNWFLCFS